MRAGHGHRRPAAAAGLEPGRIARLTVLVGDVTGLVPADGDLGEGDQVALLDTRSLLLGIARSSRYTGVDNPRLWTTADVRAGLEALGLTGRGPVVEELNGEGFPYSRTCSAGRASWRPRPWRPWPRPARLPRRRAAPVPRAPARGRPASRRRPPNRRRARLDPGGRRRWPAARRPPPLRRPWRRQPARPAPTRDTVAVDGPPSPPDDGGIGGLFANGEQITGPTAAAAHLDLRAAPAGPVRAGGGRPAVLGTGDAGARLGPSSPRGRRRRRAVSRRTVLIIAAGGGRRPGARGSAAG